MQHKWHATLLRLCVKTSCLDVTFPQHLRRPQGHSPSTFPSDPRCPFPARNDPESLAHEPTRCINILFLSNDRDTGNTTQLAAKQSIPQQLRQEGPQNQSSRCKINLNQAIHQISSITCFLFSITVGERNAEHSSSYLGYSCLIDCVCQR